MFSIVKFWIFFYIWHSWLVLLQFYIILSFVRSIRFKIIEKYIDFYKLVMLVSFLWLFKWLEALWQLLFMMSE